MITRALNPQALAIEEAQGQIKKSVTDLYFAGASTRAIQDRVRAIIRACLTEIKTPEIIKTAPQALYRLATAILIALRSQLGISGQLAFKRYITANRVIKGTIQEGTLETMQMGLPTRRYSKDYAKDVERIIDDIVKRQALDPDDISGRNSMRNKAEMEVRYEFHQNEIADFKTKGQKLVMCSTHADCSDRCFPWQGRVYSLDGTTGKTTDGKIFIPLETATDIFYTTKAGKVYKNGLLGYNCRHKLYAYSEGLKIPTVTKYTQVKEYQITLRQRQLEGRIRDYREKAMLFKGKNEELSKQAHKKAMLVYEKYKEFSQKNNRAFYPDRTQII